MCIDGHIRSIAGRKAGTVTEWSVDSGTNLRKMAGSPPKNACATESAGAITRTSRRTGAAVRTLSGTVRRGGIESWTTMRRFLEKRRKKERTTV